MREERGRRQRDERNGGEINRKERRKLYVWERERKKRDRQPARKIDRSIDIEKRERQSYRQR